MAVFALKTEMPTHQWKIRLHIMVELPRLPIDRGVASVALIAQTAAVRIVITVTRHTVVFRVTERWGCVALIAGDIRMRANQREA